jgi:hypothetical protein
MAVGETSLHQIKGRRGSKDRKKFFLSLWQGSCCGVMASDRNESRGNWVDQ